jgi:glycosyltransferase involved in cell wall biosynthesis
VSSSKKPESFGRSAAEALAMGTPVVATGHGGMLDIVIAGETGFLFEPGDAEGLARHILDAQARPWPGLREFVVNRFSLQQMVRKTLAVYGELGYLSDL